MGLMISFSPLAIRIAQGKKLTLTPLYVGSLYACLDEYAHNINRYVGNMMWSFMQISANFFFLKEFCPWPKSLGILGHARRGSDKTQSQEDK